MIVHSKPIGWVFGDPAEKFQTGMERTADENKYETDVLLALPWTWSNSYYAEYDMRYNRNRVHANSPEDLWLIFSVLNNSNQILALHLLDSFLFVNDIEVEKWHSALENSISAKKIENVIQPGELIEIRIKSNDFLTNDEICKFRWTVEGFS